jgi:septal ring factor EnvC (AmiA/AmiB activator)
MFHLSPHHKLQCRKCVSSLHAAALSTGLILYAFILLTPTDATAEKANKLFEVQQKIRNAWDNISESKEEETYIRKNIQEVSETIGKKEKELRNYDSQMSQTQKGIANLEKNIDMLTEALNSKKPYLKEYVNYLLKQQFGNNAFVLASANDYQDLSRRSKYISLITNYEGRAMQKYMIDLKEINAKRKELETIYAELETSKEEARNRKKELQATLSKKDELLLSVREKQIAYEKNVRELENSSQKIQGMVAATDKKAIPSSITGSGFGSFRGNLPWPIYGKVLLPYGAYKDPVYNVPVFNNGIQIEATLNDVPKSVAGGRVIYASALESYGMLLIIDHGNGYNTLYGNLSEVLLKKGDLLIKGTELGKITRSKLLNTPALYFEIRYNGKPVNTLEWLEKQG